MYALNKRYGLTPSGSSAPHTCSLTTAQWDGGEGKKGKSEKACQLR